MFLNFFVRYHAFRIVRRQELLPADIPRRLIFCQWVLTLTDAQLLEMLFSDEANFKLSGSVNSQNVRRWHMQFTAKKIKTNLLSLKQPYHHQQKT